MRHLLERLGPTAGRWTATALVLLFAGSCGGGAPPSSTTEPASPAPQMTVEADGEPIETDLDTVIEQTQDILEALTGLRGLAPKMTIPSEITTRTRLRAVLLEKLAEEVDPEEVRAEALVLRRLGVLGEDVDYYGLIVETLTSQIAGFYDEDSGRLFLLDDLPADFRAPTMAHELFHGIQDQVFGIDQVRPTWEGADDAILAATALIEGDATGVMLDYTMGGLLSFTDIPNFADLIADQFTDLDALAAAGLPDDLPRFLQEELTFPYLQGLRFVHYVKSAGDWEAVDHAYDDPPVSSEQVLHPERYVDRDPPTWVTLDVSALEELGYAVIFDQIFGEFHYGSLFRHVMGDAVAARSVEAAVTGWDGDRLLALENEATGVVVLVALTVWDSQHDAEEFQTLLERYLTVRGGVEPERLAEGEHGSASGGLGPLGWTVVERWGDMVLWLDGVPDAQAGPQALPWREVVWRGRARGPYVRPVTGAPDRDLALFPETWSTRTQNPR